jgi:hypothetical protein
LSAIHILQLDVSKQAFFPIRVLFRKNTSEHQLDVVVTSALTLGAWFRLVLHGSAFLRTNLRHARRPLVADGNAQLRAWMAQKAWVASAWHFAIWNPQACPGDNAVNDVFTVIVVKDGKTATPACQFATRELSLYSCGIFLVLSMGGFQKQFALFYQTIDGLCVLKC